MAKTKEQIIKEIMKDCECSYEDALAVYEIESKEAEGGKKERHYNKSASAKTDRKPREKKADEDKAHLISMLEIPLHNFGAEIKNPEREITFVYNGAEYSVTLTKHRPPKK